MIGYASLPTTQMNPTSGAIYLHKSLIGKTFDVFLIPTEKEPQVEEEVKKAEESLKKNLQELDK